MAASGPLAGIRILEVGHVLAGPFCGMVLGDLGADVVKIEPPEGDMARSMTANFTGAYNDYFASLNRNKRGIVLDLTSQSGQAELQRLAATAHGLVTNLRPVAIRRFGLTYDNLKDANPGIVCVALTGFGLDGPHADKPAYDYVVQALTGVMMLTGAPSAPPTRAGYSAVDNSTGLMGAIGLLAKLVEGKGGQVDIALFDTMLAQLNYLASSWLNHEIAPARTDDSAHPHLVPAQVFPTADGHLMLFISTDKFWRRFCEAVDWMDRAHDPLFATIAARKANRAVIADAIARMTRTRPTAYWVELFSRAGLVVSGVETLEEALEGPIVRDRAMIAVIPTPDGPLRLVGSPIRFSGQPTGYRPPPRLGEHTGEILGGTDTARQET